MKNGKIAKVTADMREVEILVHESVVVGHQRLSVSQLPVHRCHSSIQEMEHIFLSLDLG